MMIRIVPLLHVSHECIRNEDSIAEQKSHSAAVAKRYGAFLRCDSHRGSARFVNDVSSLWDYLLYKCPSQEA